MPVIIVCILALAATVVCLLLVVSLLLNNCVSARKTYRSDSDRLRLPLRQWQWHCHWQWHWHWQCQPGSASGGSWGRPEPHLLDVRNLEVRIRRLGQADEQFHRSLTVALRAALRYHSMPCTTASGQGSGSTFNLRQCSCPCCDSESEASGCGPADCQWGGATLGWGDSPQDWATAHRIGRRPKGCQWGEDPRGASGATTYELEVGAARRPTGWGTARGSCGAVAVASAGGRLNGTLYAAASNALSGWMRRRDGRHGWDVGITEHCADRGLQREEAERGHRRGVAE